MKIVLLTGFLGAGKTTLLSRLLASGMEGRVGVVVNEFGDVGIDGRVLQDTGYRMTELNKGSIFCACLKSQFYQALEAMGDQGVEWLFVEASGLADPSTMEDAIHYLNGKGSHAVYHGAICMVDAVYFLEQLQLLPVLERQVRYSDLVVLNKTDLQTEENLQMIEKKLGSIQPDSLIFRSQFCDVDLSEILTILSHRNRQSVPSLNTWDSRMKTIVVRDGGENALSDWKRFIESMVKDTYRVKGFIQSMEGSYQVSGVGKNLRWEIGQDNENTELVFFSSIGIRLISQMIQTAENMGMDVDIRM